MCATESIWSLAWTIAGSVLLVTLVTIPCLITLFRVMNWGMDYIGLPRSDDDDTTPPPRGDAPKKVVSRRETLEYGAYTYDRGQVERVKKGGK